MQMSMWACDIVYVRLKLIYGNFKNTYYILCTLPDLLHTVGLLSQ